MSNISLVREALQAGEGIVRLAPCWVPRSFLMPGGRLKLDPRDLYASRRAPRRHRRALVLVHHPGRQRSGDAGRRRPELHRDRRQARTAARKPSKTSATRFLGADVMARYGGWNVLCKFFDNLGPIPHHMHQTDEHAQAVGQKGKPEAYYFPPQYNFKDNNFPYTFMGLEPGTTPRRRAPLPGTLERGRQRHPVPLARRTS